MDLLAASRLQGQPLQGLYNMNMPNSNFANLDMATYYLQGGHLQTVYNQGQAGLLNSAAYYPSTLLPQVSLSGSGMLGSIPGSSQRATLLEIPQTTDMLNLQNKTPSYSVGLNTSGAISQSDTSGSDN